MSRFQLTAPDFPSNASSLADPPHPSTRKVFIEAEQIRLLYEQAPTSFFVTLLNAGLLTIVLREVVPAHRRFVWLGVVLVIALARITLVYAYRRSAPSVEQARRWRTWFIIGAGCAGLAWGSAGILLFPPDSLAHQIFVAFVLGGMITGAVAVLSWVKAAFIAFLLPTALPLIVRFFLQGGELFWAMGTMSLIFIAALVTISCHLYASITESLWLRFDKTELIHNLSLSEHQTAAANIALREEVAERKRAQDELRMAHDELERRVQERTAELLAANVALLKVKDEVEMADRAKSEFLAAISHELRTPLSIIMGYTDLMSEEVFGALTREQTDILKRVKRNARELHELITAMLDLSRLEAGRLPVDIRMVSIVDLIAEVRDELQEIQTQSGLQFVWVVDPQLAAPIATDPGKLKIILKNLVGNAVRFTARGSITIDAHASRGGVEICVTDTGIGIPEEGRLLIFEPFQQVSSSLSHQRGGTGLGLHIVKRLLELLGGEVSVESEEGRGSTFRIWTPTHGHTLML